MAHELIAVLTLLCHWSARSGAVDHVAVGTGDRGSGFRKCRVNTMTSETKIIVGSTIRNHPDDGNRTRRSVTALFVNLGSGIDSLRPNIREDYQWLDNRMRTVEQGLARIDQLLATLERVVIPAAEPLE